MSVDMSARQRIWTLTVLCYCLGMVVGTLGGIYPVVAEISRNTGASLTEVTWIVDAYTLVLAGLLLPAGTISDRFGRRGVMNAGMVVFTLGAGMALVLDTPTGLMAARAVCGMGGAFVLPSTLSLVTSTFPPEHRYKAVGIWTAAFAGAGGVLVALAGVLLEFGSWRAPFWMFFIGGLLALIGGLTIPTSREARPPRIDVWGTVMSAISVSALVYGLIEAGLRGWSDPRIVGALALGIVAAAAFVLIELRTPEPMLDVRLFAIRGFGASAYAVFIAFASIYGVFFLLMQFQQFVLADSALVAGAMAATMGIGVFPVIVISNILTRRYGLRMVIMLGCLVQAGAFVILLLTDVHSSLLLPLGIYLVVGLGNGFAMAPCTAAIISEAPPEKQGVAAAVNHTTREMGTTLGVALVGGVLTAGYTDNIRAATESLPPPARAASLDSVAGAIEVANASGPAGAPFAAAARDAFVSGMHDVGLVMVVLLLGSAVIGWFWAPGAKRPETADVPVGLRGRVLLDSGAPVPDAALTLVGEGGEHVGSTRTGTDGGYRFPTGPLGRHLLVCVAAGLTPKATMVALNGSGVEYDIALDGTHELSGVVRDAAGRALAGARLTVHDEARTLIAEAVSDPTGRYRLGGLPAGTHTLVAAAVSGASRAVSVPATTGADVAVPGPR